MIAVSAAADQFGLLRNSAATMADERQRADASGTRAQPGENADAHTYTHWSMTLPVGGQDSRSTSRSVESPPPPVCAHPVERNGCNYERDPSSAASDPRFAGSVSGGGLARDTGGVPPELCHLLRHAELSCNLVDR